MGLKDCPPETKGQRSPDQITGYYKACTLPCTRHQPGQRLGLLGPVGRGGTKYSFSSVVLDGQGVAEPQLEGDRQHPCLLPAARAGRCQALLGAVCGRGTGWDRAPLGRAAVRACTCSRLGLSPRRAQQDTGWAQPHCADGEEQSQALSTLDRVLGRARGSASEAMAINNSSPGACCRPCTGSLQHKVHVWEPTGRAAVKRRAGRLSFAFQIDQQQLSRFTCVEGRLGASPDPLEEGGRQQEVAVAALHALAGQGQELCSAPCVWAGYSAEGTPAPVLPHRAVLHSPLLPRAALRRDPVAGVLAWRGPLRRVPL